MTQHKQVDKDHYQFARYMTKARWSSLWHQVDEVRRLQPERVLEIGPGPGLFKKLAAMAGLHVETVDIDPELGPDHVASATALPFADAAFDVVCAFQMLEHLPYEQSLAAIKEMARVAGRGIVVSLPDVREVWPFLVSLPKIGEVRFVIPKPVLKARDHQFDGQHYWEIGKRGYEASKVIQDFTVAGWQLSRTYRVFDHQYHRFLVFVPVRHDADRKGDS